MNGDQVRNWQRESVESEIRRLNTALAEGVMDATERSIANRKIKHLHDILRGWQHNTDDDTQPLTPITVDAA